MDERYRISHDPCRMADRFPLGAVAAGTSVTLVLRIDHRIADRVLEVALEVLDPSGETTRILEDRSVTLDPPDGMGRPNECARSFVIDTSGDPRVLFYRFVVSTEEGRWVCRRRGDGMATAGEVVPLESDGLPTWESCFQLTVYDPSFSVPDWYRGSIMYQIFPDRFARGPEGILREGIASHESRGWPIRVHEDWNDPPDWEDAPDRDGARDDSWEIGDEGSIILHRSHPEGMAPYDPIDFFGGTLSGIGSKLDYLESLGVTTIYLNPICEARSNHRYDTGDYERVDPILGDWGSFRILAESARSRGMRIVLDTVLSHTGSSSRYFDLDRSYESFGAALGYGSPYRSWYDFEHGSQYAPYRCWWNDPSLPEIEEHDESWQRFVLGRASSDSLPSSEDDLASGPGSEEDAASCAASSSGGLLADWASHGASGFRLDVADELPDDVLEGIREAAKRADPDAVVIGEVWEDPTTKESYGSRRRYALGSSLDTVMNYPLRSALLGFALGGIGARQLRTFLRMQRSNYPMPMYEGLMNLLSSHDVERVRSVLDVGREFRDMPRPEQRRIVEGITDEMDHRGSRLQGVLACMVHMLPGVPCIYYGDERGMQGGRDPFDRATFPWDGRRNDTGRDLTGLYQALGRLRKGSEALESGGAAFYSQGDDACFILRFPKGISDRGLPMHARLEGTTLCVANRSDRPIDFTIDLVEEAAGLSLDESVPLRYGEVRPRCVLTTEESGVLPGTRLAIEDGIVRGTIGPLQANVIRLDSGLQASMPEGVGIICHVTSVPNEDGSGRSLGPGTLGEPARRFVDSLAANGVRYWQVLPLGPTDEYGSPYAGLSAFAGNVALIDRARDESEGHRVEDSGSVASGGHARCDATADPLFAGFVRDNAAWLVPHAVFVALKGIHGGALWRDWPSEHRDLPLRRPDALEASSLAGMALDDRTGARIAEWAMGLANELVHERHGEDEVPFVREASGRCEGNHDAASALVEAIMREMSLQFEFDRQWCELRGYARSKGVLVIGDMPIYVSSDSSDAWLHRGLLSLDEDGRISNEGGVPPDPFSDEGQAWGVPTYDWQALEADGFEWWLDRLERAFGLYDYVRLDHFIGFESFYSIARGRTARDGEWEEGPGIRLFRKAYERFGPLPIIAEDLGILSPRARSLVAETGFTGMDVIQFSDGDPLEHWEACEGKASFSGTHDTQTLVGWVQGRYPREDPRKAADALIERVLSSSSAVRMLTLQDALGLDDSARMNVPGTTDGNWRWQATAAQLDGLDVGRRIRGLSPRCSRDQQRRCR